MPSSTVSLRSVVDYVTSVGQLAPIIPTGGYSTETAIRMGTDVMRDILKQKFNFKFNSFRVNPFYTNSWQSDYPTNTTRIGWLERCVAIDINNTSTPKPRCWPEVVRDLETSFYAGSPPDQVSWFVNYRLEYGVWPGPNSVYTSPIGAVQIPVNGPVAFVDANSNILSLTTYGTTGAHAPVLPTLTPAGTNVNDGSCIWTVCDPWGQGFRVSPLPPQSGVVFQVNLIAQAKPPMFNSLGQMIDPIPDDFSGAFFDGFMVYAYKMSPDPKISEQFAQRWQMWQASLFESSKQGDRERDNAGFYPDRGVMAPGDVGPIGPANPYGYTNWIGR
jgi:hypothetical protein